MNVCSTGSEGYTLSIPMMESKRGEKLIPQYTGQDQHFDTRGKRRTGRIAGHFLGLIVLSYVCWVSFTRAKYIGSIVPVKEVNQATQASCHGQQDLVPSPSQSEFNWTALIPSRKLHWTDCHEKFKCARLEVPLDYSEPDGEKAGIALIKLPSVIPPEKEGYKGPILFNPGGPGGSGITFVLGSSTMLQEIVGNDYDIIGFDPRGVGYTTPGLFTFYSKVESAAFFTRATSVNASADSLGTLVGGADIIGTLAKARQEKVAQHMSTAVVARDMLSIVRAHGQEKLQYWGFSYGTVLGATFAAMFPNNVGRLIIDGVVDSPNYYQSAWSNNLRDTDKVLDFLYSACAEAGPEKCGLYEEDAQAVGARVEKLLDDLKTNPKHFYNQTTGDYGIVDFSMVKFVIFRALYQPYTIGKRLFSALADIEKGNPEPIWKIGGSGLKKSDYSCSCPAIPPIPFAEGSDLTLAIACGEGEPVNGDLEELKEFYAKLGESSVFADVWWIHTGCAGWKVRAKDRFTGPFVTNTSFPLLLIGNTADPVTPLWSAHKMSAGFKDSVVLTLDGFGHCSVSATSLCASKAIRAYFRDGVMPEKGTICHSDRTVFDEDPQIDELLSMEDKALLRASRMLGEEYPVHIVKPF